MLKRISVTTKSLVRFAAVLACVACGDKPVAPIIPVEPPVVVPPTLIPSTSQAFEAELNGVLDVFPAVTVRDQNGNGIPSVWVQWTPSSGKVENDSSLTDTNGKANAGRWTLSTVSGTQTVTARARGVSVVAMTASVAPGPFVALVTVSTNITGVVGSTVTTPAAVKAVDRYGNPVPRVFVQFAKFAGDGSITGAGQTTNENGIATVGSWTLGPKAGPQAIRADDSRTGANTLIPATALPASASQIVVIEGDAQTGQADRRLCTSPIIAVRDQFGNGIGQVPIVFTPGAGSGTVTQSSVTSSTGTGYAALGAWTLSASATQTLVVTSPSLPGLSATLTATVAPGATYAVCVRFVGDATPRMRQAVGTAVQRWQRVIVGHVQTSPLVETANRCFDGAPAINETVEDLLLFVRVTNIDGPGNVAAQAGACTVHLPTTLTQMGVLKVDSADVESLLGQNILDNLLTHEFGHVLGFGTLWVPRNLLFGAGTADPVFTGASARTQFTRLFSTYPGVPVPVENTGDSGTANSHWRRTVFNNELMQGFTSPTMPMSVVTVGSLADLGYAVDLTKADPFAFTGAVPSSAVRASSIRNVPFANDILDGEIWGVERNGRRVLVRSARNPLAPN